MDCYNCQHSAPLAGDCHLECRLGLQQCLSGLPKEQVTIRVSLNPHGVLNGWAMWPFNFDPIWVDKCNSHATITTQQQEDCYYGA